MIIYVIEKVKRNVWPFVAQEATKWILHVFYIFGSIFTLHDFFRNILADVCIISNMFDICQGLRKNIRQFFFVNAKGDVEIVKFA